MSRDDPSASSELHAFEAWAQISARLYRRGVAERARAVHEVGLENRWHEIDEACFRRLAADIEAGRLERLERFLTILSDVRTRQSSPELPSPVQRHFSGVHVPDDTDSAPESSTPPPYSETPPFAHQLDDGSVTGPLPDEEVETDDGAETKLRATELREAMVAAEQVSGWSIERFSWAVTAEQQSPERAEAFWREEAIITPAARSAAHRLWEKRLARDPSLREEHRKLVDDFAGRFRRGEEGEPPA